MGRWVGCFLPVVGHVAAGGKEEDVGEVSPHPRRRGVDDAHNHPAGPACLTRGQGGKEVGHQLAHHRVEAWVGR